MKCFVRWSAQIVIILLTIQSLCWAKKIQEFGQTYKKVSDELINIRKEFTATQPRVYALLDQVDSMNRIMHELHNKKNSYKKKYHDLGNQTELLKNKNLMLKEKVLALTGELEKTIQNLAQEQQVNAALKDEYDRLKTARQEIKTPANIIQPDQSFNLTSTSEPTSPR